MFPIEGAPPCLVKSVDHESGRNSVKKQKRRKKKGIKEMNHAQRRLFIRITLSRHRKQRGEKWRRVLPGMHHWGVVFAEQIVNRVRIRRDKGIPRREELDHVKKQEHIPALSLGRPGVDQMGLI